MSNLSARQTTFANALAMDTGLDQRVVQAWVEAESGGADKPGFSQYSTYNWLNVTGTNGQFETLSSDPTTGAKQTAQWLQQNPLSGAPILASAGQPPAAQLSAIGGQNLPSGHAAFGTAYKSLVQDYNTLTTGGRIVQDLSLSGDPVTSPIKSATDAASATAGFLSAISGKTFLYYLGGLALLIVAGIVLFRRPIASAARGAGEAAVAA